MIETATATFEFFKGDTYTRNFTIEGLSLPISKVYFTVKENTENKNFDLQKTLKNGITLVEENKETNSRTYNINIDATDTDNMKTDTDYSFDVEIQSQINDNLVYKQTVITGVLRLKDSATSTYNEK